MRCTSLTICAGSLDRRIQRYIDQRDIESVEHQLNVAQDSLGMCVSIWVRCGHLRLEYSSLASCVSE